jgi:hypothetical protein
MMSSFSGRAEEPWSLARAVDALAGAARAAGRPGWIWIAGLGYPSLGMGLGAGLSEEIGWAILVPPGGIDEAMLTMLFSSLLFLPVVLLVMRLRVGLARIAPPGIWQQLVQTFGKARLRQAWRAGKGLTLSTFGMLAMLTLMTLAAMVIVIMPVLQIAERGLDGSGNPLEVTATLALVVPVGALMIAYSLLLVVLHQLALQSLAHNRRGIASALTHAWRIARHDPWASGRTLAVDLLLNVTIFVIVKVLATVLWWIPIGRVAVILVALALLGFSGVTRAGYWARAYRALGGLSPDDQVPGLENSGW